MFESTIDPKKLTLADWIMIANILERDARWGYYKWAETSDTPLSSISLEDWEKIESLCEFKDGWSYFQYRDNRA